MHFYLSIFRTKPDMYLQIKLNIFFVFKMNKYTCLFQIKIQYVVPHLLLFEYLKKKDK